MKKLLTFAALFFLFALLTACGDKKSEGISADESNVLIVLAGSELKDIEPLLPQVEKATGYKLQLHYTGTLDAVERLQGGEHADVAWLASNRYAMLIPAVKSRILASERTMITPVVLGIKTSKAQELGWVNNTNITWKDISAAAVKGRFTFGMTNPASSNTGFSGLLGLAAALSGKGDALEEKDINAKQLAAFFRAQRLTAGSSGWLADAYLNEQDKVDGIVNYASTLASLNQNSRLKEKLFLIYPKEGILTSDYPIMLVNAAKREAYDKVVAYLRGKEFQQAMTQSTLRRPVNPDVESADKSAQTLVELPFPARLEVVDAILTAFDNQLRLPTDSTFVLDQSGSMGGSRIDSLKKAMVGLTGGDTSISGRFSRFRNRERIFVLPFSSQFGELQPFDMGGDKASNEATLQAISNYVDALNAGGGTAMFEATRKAYQDAVLRRHAEPARFYSIVVMTDGQSNEGMDDRQFGQWYDSLPNADKGIKIFPVVFGDANQNQLQTLADLTGGRVFDSRKHDLQSIFKEIRGYQ